MHVISSLPCQPAPTAQPRNTFQWMFRCLLKAVPQPSLPEDLIPPLWMSTSSFQSRDAVTKITRGGTQALLDFLAETEPPSTTTGSGTPNAVERNNTQRGPLLGGLALERAKVRLGLSRSKKKEKFEEEGEKGSLRINTPPPGTVAITRNSGYYGASIIIIILFMLIHFPQAHRVYDQTAGTPTPTCTATHNGSASADPTATT